MKETGKYFELLAKTWLETKWIRKLEVMSWGIEELQKIIYEYKIENYIGNESERL